MVEVVEGTPRGGEWEEKPVIDRASGCNEMGVKEWRRRGRFARISPSEVPLSEQNSHGQEPGITFTIHQSAQSEHLHMQRGA